MFVEAQLLFIVNKTLRSSDALTKIAKFEVLTEKTEAPNRCSEFPNGCSGASERVKQSLQTDETEPLNKRNRSSEQLKQSL
ncbi:hypothetical protein JCM6292_1644 [Bacteroides pyogenes JCM 6292]|uniref:Uncharacterized protein n=2 Tax=Bacteroides pyogenes TaxID=310300 RepID=W4PGN9_9BACE|nr:hypothetical protein JCM6292_1644 [Bacteroides pyogenes JCM 6292]GAE18961.1 hypothetical protein JCM6294_1944 [Bacteroides pyogenes DSM 20611 = JCM 6294]